MFESLSDKLGGVFGKLSSSGKLSEKDIDAALREVRLALLEADVDFKVARQFVKNVKERADGDKIYASLTPGQSVIRIVRDELAEILGGESAELARADKPPSVIMLVGLQGAGKTTTVAKLSKFLKEQSQKSVMVVSADVYRPAAIQQLETLATEVGVQFFASDSEQSPEVIAAAALKANAEAKVEDLRK